MTAGRRALIVVAVLCAVAFGLPGVSAVREAAAQGIQVVSADPASAEQGTISLPVTIKGSGFKKGAKAKFYLGGTTNPAGITVSSTRFIDSTQLTATIDIAGTATVAGFDIVVQNADGRTGKGTELFSVLTKIDACTADPEPVAGYGISEVSGFPGYLDGTFGNGTGRVIGPRHMQIASVYGRGIAIDAEGRIVAAGVWYDKCAPKSLYEWAIVRYLPDGSLDNGFGATGNGMVRIPFEGTDSAGGGHSLVVQPDGKIVIAGYAKPTRRGNSVPVVVRLDQDGQLDTTFGTNGIAWVSPGGATTGGFNSVVLQSDGKIVAAGWVNFTSVAQNKQGFISRLESDGTLDTSFGSTGGMYMSGPPTTNFKAATTQWIGPDERIVVAGDTDNALGQAIGTVWRFTNAGVLDNGFGAAGVAMIPLPGDDDGYEFSDLAIDSSNRIVTTCWFGPFPQWRLALVRYDIAGNLDSTFGTGGMALAPTEAGMAMSRGVGIQGDGRILVAGILAVPDGTGNYLESAGVWRFLPSGSPDPAFGEGGRVFDPITSERVGVGSGGLVVQPDGRIIWAGHVSRSGRTVISYAVLARFWQ